MAKATYTRRVLLSQYNPLIPFVFKTITSKSQKAYIAPDIYGHGQKINCYNPYGMDKRQISSN